MSKHVVILEGNMELAKIYAEILGRDFRTTILTSIADYRSATGLNGDIDLLITELVLPDGNWTSSDLEPVRSQFRNLPVLLVTRVDDSAVIQAALNDWASDCMTKPVNNNELLAKCRYLTAVELLYECDAVGMTVSRRGRCSEELTANEFRLMTLIARSEGYAVPVAVAAKTIWGEKVSDQRIHTMLSRLRPKVRPLRFQLEMSREGSIVLHDLAAEV